jgi:hypothetical protein
MINWRDVYCKEKGWQISAPHCKHCYREGFFDAGVTSLIIIIALIMVYGIEVMT